MRTIATHLIAAAAIVVLAGLSTSCSSGSSTPEASPSTVTVTATESSSATQAATATDGVETETATGTPAPATVAPQPAANFAVGSYYAFSSPSGKLQCRSTTATLVCQTVKQPHTVSTNALCNFYPGDEQSRAVQFGYFPDKRTPCATIIQGNLYAASRVLGYGESVVFTLAETGLRITCASETRGLTCTDDDASDGAGFFLSGDSFTLL